MPTYRPSFMALVTLKLDEGTVVTPGGLGMPVTLSSLHPKLLRALWPQGRLATAHRIPPLKLEINKNSHMTADRCQISFAWRNLPIDPRSVVGGVLQVFGGTVRHSDYGRGISQLRGDDLVEPLSIIKSTQDKSMFVGMFDSTEIDFGDSGSFTRIRARDLTQLMLDYKIPTWVMNDLPDFDVPLNVWVQRLINTNPVIRASISGVDLKGWPVLPPGQHGPPEPVPLASSSVSSNDLRQSVAKGKTGKRKKRRNPKLMTGTKYWDMIVDVCVGAGVIPNVHNDRIVLRPAQTFYGPETHRDSRFSRSFNGVPQSVRRFVYGRHLKQYKLKRKHGGSTVPIIRVVANTPAGRVISAAWPPGLLQKPPVVPSHPFGQSMDRKIMVVPFYGSTDPKVLAVVARTLWELMARQEFSGNITTGYLSSDMGDLEGVVDPNDDPDLLWLEVGDPIEIMIDNGGRLHGLRDEVMDVYSKSEAEIATHLRGFQGGSVSDDDLLKIAKAIKSPRLQRFFRCSGVNIKFESGRAGKGVEIKINFHNYYEVVWSAASRDDFDLLPGGPISVESDPIPLP